MALFGKKAPVAQSRPAPGGIPTEYVLQMRQQGLTNNQIIQNLQREGYGSTQIFDAMSQADIKGVVESMPPEQGVSPEYAQEEPMPPMPELPPEPTMPEMRPMPAAESSMTKQEIEEIAEGIIDEKWEELMKSVEKVVAWKEATDAKFAKMEQQFEDLKANFEELHKGILSKVSEYDSNIKSVGADIKAMENVFKKVLPSLTENVGELSRITKKLKD